MNTNRLLLLPFTFLIAGSFQSCNENAGAKDNGSTSSASAIQPYEVSDGFKNYWYAGKAEVSSYKLVQARYSELHEGTAVMIFVTEDFSKSKQVKLDDPQSAGADRLPVMKMNLSKKFNTGIYPYSMMLSVFSPVDVNNFPHAVKTAASIQEWCGMAYMQLNQRNTKNEVTYFSYFEKEEDQKAAYELCLLEDELWNLIRIAPEKLPTGNHKVLPGSFYTRLSHVSLKVQDAQLSLKEDEGYVTYSINYPSQQHNMNITFQKNFPHKIISWNETFPGFDGQLLMTTASLQKTLITDYWRHHDNTDRAMREELSLPRDF